MPHFTMDNAKQFGALGGAARSRSTVEERLWSRVDKNGPCWLWTGKSTVRGGYGVLSYKGRLTVAHVVAWVLTNGPIPDGLRVLHNCPGGDNPACVNPGHLWLGTIADNNKDAGAKGRHHMQVNVEQARAIAANARAARTAQRRVRAS